MTGWKTFAALGLALLVGPGAGAQPPGDDGAPSPRERLRARVVALRTEVELLKIEHDADREDLIATMRQLRKLRRDGLDKDRLEAIEAVARQFFQIKARADGGPSPLAQPLPNLPGFPQPDKIDPKEFYAQIENDKDMSRMLKEKGIKAEDLTPIQFEELLVEGEKRAYGERLGKEIEHKRARFADLSRRLHEKRLDLEDAERRYRETR